VSKNVWIVTMTEQICNTTYVKYQAQKASYLIKIQN
jgi:hypothetical protein